MHPGMLAALALVLVLMGVYAFPVPKASFRAAYARVPPAVAASLEAFRRRHRPKFHTDAGGLRWPYLDAGRGAEAILFLHGLAGSADVWFQQITALEERFRCLAVTIPPAASLDRLRFGIHGILAREGLSGAFLAGSSMGGYLAQFLASKDPEVFRRAALLNTFAPNPFIRGRAQRGANTLPWLPEWVVMAGLRRHARRSLAPPGAEGEIVRAYLFEQTCGALRKADLCARLRCLCQAFELPQPARPAPPMLIIESEDDPLLGQELRRGLRAAYPAARVVALPRGGHFACLTRPRETTAALAELFSAPAA